MVSAMTQPLVTVEQYIALIIPQHRIVPVESFYDYQDPTTDEGYWVSGYSVIEVSPL